MSTPATIRPAARSAPPAPAPAPADRTAPPAPARIRVFLLDDHELVRRGLTDLLTTEPGIEIVGESGSAVEAARWIPVLRPDVAILDGRLPDGSGISVCREIRSIDPRINVLILTSYDDEEALFSAIMAGASGYVLKDARGGALIDGIRQVAAGRSLLDPAVTRRVLDRMRAEPAVPDDLRRLTDQETRILELITAGLTNRQIGERLFLAEKTVKNYVSNVLAKLGVERRTQAAVYGARTLGGEARAGR